MKKHYEIRMRHLVPVMGMVHYAESALAYLDEELQHEARTGKLYGLAACIGGVALTGTIGCASVGLPMFAIAKGIETLVCSGI